MAKDFELGDYVSVSAEAVKDGLEKAILGTIVEKRPSFGIVQVEFRGWFHVEDVEKFDFDKLNKNL